MVVEDFVVPMISERLDFQGEVLLEFAAFDCLAVLGVLFAVFVKGLFDELEFLLGVFGVWLAYLGSGRL